MNIYNRIFNILIEAASFGGSPSRTGQRVGKAMTKLKAKLGAGSPEYAEKRAQTRRIMHKTSKRQEIVHHGSKEAEDANDARWERDNAYRAPEAKLGRSKRQKQQSDAERGATYGGAQARFKRNYAAGKSGEQGVDSRGNKIDKKNPGKGAMKGL